MGERLECLLDERLGGFADCWLGERLSGRLGDLLNALRGLPLEDWFESDDGDRVPFCGGTGLDVLRLMLGNPFMLPLLGVKIPSS